MHEPSTWIGKGQLLLAKGDLEQAFSAFKIVPDGDRDNVLALLGQACVQFIRGRYSDSMDLYTRALQAYPQCPGSVRLGIGLCRYKLGQHAKAKLAFQRVLQLDPENVEALVALGIMDLHTNEATDIRKGMDKMQRTFEIYPYCAMSSNYLANHFFFTGQHFLIEQLTETALAVTNHGPTKSHSYYNLARSYHSKGDYEKTGLYYMASVKEISKPQDLVLPYYGLGQVQLKLADVEVDMDDDMEVQIGNKLRRDAVLVFRTLCKLSMKTPPKEALADPQLMRGKIVALELLKILLENAGAIFRTSDRFTLL